MSDLSRHHDPRPDRQRMDRARRWAIVLAAGDGTRLRAVARSMSGQPMPKQYWSPDGGASLLRQAIARADRLVPRERIVTVVAAHHAPWWRAELSPLLPEENVLPQPNNRGTAAGILLPLLSILRRDPGARVAILPSDHAVADEWLLASTFEEAFGAVEQAQHRVVLLGMALSQADASYGWILPCRQGVGPAPGPWAVRAFVEKPTAKAALRLLRQGALVSGFLLAASGDTLAGLYRRLLPELSEAFSRLPMVRGGFAPGALAACYETLPVCDFSADLLTPAAEHLDVLRVPPCGWTDLGTPERVRRWVAVTRGAAGARASRPRTEPWPARRHATPALAPH